MTETATNGPPTTEAAPHLRRVLSLWDLILFGLICVTPSAPVTIYGLTSVSSKGHALDCILLAMVAMVLTAISYGRMAALYPAAGSAYTYVGRGIHPYMGFLAGWAMTLDYIITPLFCITFGTIWGLGLLEPIYKMSPAEYEIAYILATAAFTGLITFLNLRGIRTTARTNEVLMALMGTGLLAFIALAIHYLFNQEGWSGVFSVKPFYNPETFDAGKITTATSVAVLTYLGFDSVTTLAEDVKDARRNVLIAVVTVCLFTGLFGGLLVYLSQLVWPDYSLFDAKDADTATAFMKVCKVAGGVWLAQAIGILLVIANIGCALGTQVGGARLLFSMGRDNVLPRRVFGYLHPTRNTPTINIWLIGILGFAGAQVLPWQVTAEILNFGALLAFMGVNLAVAQQFWFLDQGARKRNFFIDILLPLAGAVFCFVIWDGLNWNGKAIGGVWFLIGLWVLESHTRGFKKDLAMIDMKDSD